MKESDIRADSFREESARLYKIDQEKILRNKDDFVAVTCPACTDPSYNELHERCDFRFVECKKCETIFINPRPTMEMLKEHYTTSLAEKFWRDNIYPQSEENRVKLIVKPRIAKILTYCEQYGIPTETFADIGAGYGTLCEQIQKLEIFKKVYAVEPDPVLADSCRQKGISTIQEMIENATLEPANVITSIECIEHVFDPLSYLESLSTALTSGGLLFLTTPNVKGLELSLLRRSSTNMLPPDHINYFHPASISILLERAGFTPLEISTPGKLDVELIKKEYEKGDYDFSENLFLKQIIAGGNGELAQSFQDWIACNLLSSHMWVVARKKC